MPKTAIHEYGHFTFSRPEIGIAWDITKMRAKPDPLPPDLGAQFEFYGSVEMAHTGHPIVEVLTRLGSRPHESLTREG